MENKNTVLEELERIEMNSATCKFAHFKSSNSKESLTLILGIPVVVINVFISSTFIDSFGDYSTAIISLLSLLAATLAGVQTYLSYQKKSTLHIEVGNMYSEIERECRVAKGKYQASVLSDELAWEVITKLELKYSEANKKAQECPLSESALIQGRKKFSTLCMANKADDSGDAVS
ncbi:SLATT domain-containing protein [Vreelandella nanhaiensis]|uniref:SLATT domain-containing protein n=1 Tax=Vreelandella nanhaiensis TaxID=1258546 RepID=A0A3S0Y6V2_9GAMM|nr:SLATT domain-containing protein [Halomonas nanhaiensis]RUR31661.1 SLATT domain-containing protein [Halomonas nanhaiensis]